MKSPFAVFRKHARVLTVLLTVLAMFAFIVLSSLDASQFPMVIGVLLGAGIFWYFGARAGKPGEYALAGAVLGGILAFVATKDLGGPDRVVETTMGGLTHRELTQLEQKRRAANEFMRQAFLRSNGDQSFMMPRPFGFGLETLEKDVVMGHLLRHEADELGIVVSNMAVNEFIHRETNEKLGAGMFAELCREMRLSQSELLDVIRGELKARIALQMTYPRNLPTPQRYWRMYRKLNVRQQIDAVTVPVSAYVDDVPQPSKDELAAFFEEHKSVFVNVAGPGKPGFRQPRKVRLAYLEADFETVKADVDPVSDEEVGKYYDENKEQFRNRSFPQDGLDFDESKPLDPPFAPDEDDASEQPVEAPKPANPETSSTNEAFPIQLVSTQAPAEELSADEEPAAEKPTAEKPAIDEPAPEEPAGEDQPVEAPKPDEKTDEEKPASKKPLPEYRPLDDDLKEIIRDQLATERAREVIRKIVGEQAGDFMFRLRDEINAPTENDEKSLSAQEASEQLKDYAASNNLRYVATDWLSVFDLFDVERFPVGAAKEPAEPGANPFEQTNAVTVIGQMFDTPPDLKYSPAIAEDRLTHNWYAYWKIGDRAEHVPTFDEPGIKEQVLEAWKQYKARPKAKKRAEELAEIARSSDKPMDEALEEKTLTAQPNSQKINVQQTESFSWLRQSSVPGANPFQPRPPVLSAISAIEKVDDDVMQALFEELSEGDVDVVPNADRTAYHVVRIKNRTSATKAGKDILHQTFMNEDMFFVFSPYVSLMRQNQVMANSHWRSDLTQRYDVRWKKSAERSDQ